MLNNGFFIFITSVTAYGYLNNYISTCSTLFIVCLATFIRFVYAVADSDMILQFYEYFGKPREKLNGKVIWITGSSTGIGAAIAMELSHCKVKLVLSAKSEDKLNAIKQKCIANGIVRRDDVLVLPFDMTNLEKHQWALTTVLNKFGKLDILVSNAGRGQIASWGDIELSVDKAIFDLNVFALINLSRLVTPHFLDNGGGSHVVMSSVAGKMPSPFSSSYAASKHALMGYFETLRAEKGSKGISITLICPGPVESSIFDSIFTEQLGKKPDGTRPKKLMPAERCAQLSVVAMANKLSEAWICHQPILTLLYLGQYLPALFKWYLNTFDLSNSNIKMRETPPKSSKQH